MFKTRGGGVGLGVDVRVGSGAVVSTAGRVASGGAEFGEQAANRMTSRVPASSGFSIDNKVNGSPAYIIRKPGMGI
jgi:hypothetical protein